MRFCATFLALGLLTSVACHPGPVINPGPNQTAVGGTIAGIVSTSAKDPIPGRKVTAINTQTGTRFDATTGVNGGYTIKVPEGTYRLEVELRPGEVVATQPGETHVNRSDLDPQRHFVITLGRAS
jgi:Carboxypeptidase regulatory-like domain